MKNEELPQETGEQRGESPACEETCTCNLTHMTSHNAVCRACSKAESVSRLDVRKKEVPPR